MVIIKVCGGLGNQLFQFALYRKMIVLGKDVYLDKYLYKNKKSEKRDYCLDMLSDRIRYCSNKQRRKLSDHDRNILFRYFQNRRGLKDSHYCEKMRSGYDENIFLLADAYLEGYWQNSKYFSDIRKEILQELHFNIPEDKIPLFGEISLCASVGIHVRRGDYLKDSLRDGICTMEYYKGAMHYLEEKISVDKYYIFSDDIAWCKQHFTNGSKITFVDSQGEKEAVVDMKLMSACKHNIIANSTFSWWAAWLNENPQKIVIAPSTWLKGYEFDIWCDDWVKL